MDDEPLFEPIKRRASQRERFFRHDWHSDHPKLLPRCKGKMSYPTRRIANNTRQGLLARGTATMLRIYSCPHCPYWHLTHKTGTNNNSK